MDTTLQKTLAHLIRAEQYAALGTLRDGAPFVSMILFAASPDFQSFYTLISKLAHHTQDIDRDPRVSLLIIESGEDVSEDPQQRARLTIVGEALVVAVDSLGRESIETLYTEKYPQAGFNLTLNDFTFYRITPRHARYVAGFAQAFNLLPEDLERIARV
jgi:putative heme iron utilization protein